MSRILEVGEMVYSLKIEKFKNFVIEKISENMGPHECNNLLVISYLYGTQDPLLNVLSESCIK